MQAIYIEQLVLIIRGTGSYNFISYSVCLSALYTNKCYKSCHIPYTQYTTTLPTPLPIQQTAPDAILNFVDLFAL